MNENNACCATRPDAVPINKISAGIPSSVKPYVPLLAMTIIALVQAFVLHDAWGLPFMSTAMGIWLIQFALVKFLNLPGFVARFAKYDLLTKKLHGYGYIFPFLELILGLAYLGRYLPYATSLSLLVLAVTSLVGIIPALRRQEKLSCACMGAGVDVPLSFVAVLENGLMIVMALFYLLA